MSSTRSNQNNDVSSDPAETIPQDLFETNPDVVKAELDFFSTPHSYEYRDLAYGAIKSIQQTCTTDYKNVCYSQQNNKSNKRISNKADGVKKNDEIYAKFQPADEQIIFIESNELPHEFQMINSIFSQLAFGSPRLGSSAISDPFVFEIIEGRRRRRLQERTTVDEISPSTSNYNLLHRVANSIIKPAVESVGSVVTAVMKAAAPPSSPQSMVGKRMGIRPIKAEDQPVSGPPRFHHGGVIAGREPKPMSLDNRQQRLPPFSLRDPAREASYRIHAAPLPAGGKRSLREDRGRDHGRDHGEKHHPPPEDEDEEGEGCGGEADDNYFTGYLGFGATNDLCLYQNYDKLSQPCQDSIQDLYAVRLQYWGEEQEISNNGSNGHEHGGGFVLFIMFLMFLVVLRSFRRLHNMKRRKDIKAILRAVDANPQLKAAVEQAAGVEIPRLTPLNLREKIFKTFKIIGMVILAGFTTVGTLVLSEVLAHAIMANGEAAGPVGLLIAFIIIAVFSVSVKRMRNSDVSASPRGPERLVAWVTQRFTNFRRGRSPRGAGEAYVPLAGDESGADAEMTPMHRPSNPITIFTVNGGSNGQYPQIYTGVPVSARPVSGSTYL